MDLHQNQCDELTVSPKLTRNGSVKTLGLISSRAVLDLPNSEYSRLGASLRKNSTLSMFAERAAWSRGGVLDPDVLVTMLRPAVA